MIDEFPDLAPWRERLHRDGHIRDLLHPTAARGRRSALAEQAPWALALQCCRRVRHRPRPAACLHGEPSRQRVSPWQPGERGSLTGRRLR